MCAFPVKRSSKCKIFEGELGIPPPHQAGGTAQWPALRQGSPGKWLPLQRVGSNTLGKYRDLHMNIVLLMQSVGFKSLVHNTESETRSSMQLYSMYMGLKAVPKSFLWGLCTMHKLYSYVEPLGQRPTLRCPDFSNVPQRLVPSLLACLPSDMRDGEMPNAITLWSTSPSAIIVHTWAR